MNWGKGIITGMIIFMLFILSMCFYMFRAPADEYDHQYYEKGLNFDHDYDREQQVNKDHAQPSVKQNGQTLELLFTAPVTGKVKFIRPSSQALDKSFALDSGDGNSVNLPLASIKPGQWLLILEWESNHKAYLYEQKIFIQ